MPLSATKKAIFAKIETTYGTAVNTTSTDAILVSNLDLQPIDRKSTRLNSSHVSESRMPSSA